MIYQVTQTATWVKYLKLRGNIYLDLDDGLRKFFFSLPEVHNPCSPKESSVGLVQHVFHGTNNFVTAFQSPMSTWFLVTYLSLLFKTDLSALLLTAISSFNTWGSWAMGFTSFKMCKNAVLRYPLPSLLSLLKQLVLNKLKNKSFCYSRWARQICCSHALSSLALVTTMQIASVSK